MAVSDALRAAFAEELLRLEGVGDTVDRIRAINDFFAGIDRELENVAALRLADMGDLRDRGWSYDRIAEVTGLSKARVAQLLRRREEGPARDGVD